MGNPREYWVALNIALAGNIRAAKKIVDNFQQISDAFKAPKEDLIAVGLEEEDAQTLTSSKILDRARREIEKLAQKKYSILTLEDKEYPDYLREIFDPPFVLYCAGKVEALKGPAVSIVGARKPSPYGRAVAEKIAHDLASRGIVIVSGLARGVDSIAHWGALRGGKTVAVLGSGLENIYPRENHNLFEKIIETGAIVTEFSRKAPPLGFHFPVRNRIIAGLSLALVVVEATMRSGSLISARLALEQNREVMAVPGNVTSELSQGTNWLIKAGAKPVERWEDVAEELPSPLKEELLSQKNGGREKPPAMSTPERGIFELLSPESLTHIDELVEQSNTSVSEVLSLLLHLEIKGLILQRPGKYYQRRL